MRLAAVFLFVFMYALTACAPKPIRVEPPTIPQILAAEGVTADFFSEEAGAVPFSVEEHLAMWMRAKDYYTIHRTGLTMEEKRQVEKIKLAGLFGVFGLRPTAYSHEISPAGSYVVIPRVLNTEIGREVQGWFSPLPFPRISYANPYCLICEYLHYLEISLFPGRMREKPEGDEIYTYSIIGHCTEDDPISICCWNTLAYEIPSER